MGKNVRYLRKSVIAPISHNAHVQTCHTNVISNCYDEVVQTCPDTDCVSAREKSYLANNKQPPHLNNVKETDPTWVEGPAKVSRKYLSSQ